MIKKYPFKFLDAYTKEDKDIFFGRDEEIEALYQMLFQTDLLLLYGASGTGKTSLICSGLANRFRASQWLDLYVRRGEDINQSLLDTLIKRTPKKVVSNAGDADEMDWFESMLETEKEQSADHRSNTTLVNNNPITQALNELYFSTFTPIYLIFDQFEEIYTLGEREEQQQFIETIKALLPLPIPLKVIIVIREEYLAKLYDLEMAIPQLRDKKLRIEPMDIPKVQDVILSATVLNPQSNIKLEEGKEVAIAQSIIDKIREKDVNIKLPYLQVFMDRLYETATGEPIDRTNEAYFSLDTVNQLGQIGDVLAEFIERQSQIIYNNLSKQHRNLPKDFIWKMLSPFATIEGTKSPILQQALHKIYQRDRTLSVVDIPIKETIAALENSRILRYRKEEDTYEVVHDALALQIAEKRSEEDKTYLKAKRLVVQSFNNHEDTNVLLNRDQLTYIRPHEDRLEADLTKAQLAFVSQAKQKRKRQQIALWSSIIAAFAIAILVIVMVLNEQQKTEAALKNAKISQDKATKALADFEAAQKAREITELEVLIQNTEQIANGGNCPPPSMRQVMDSLYNKYPATEGLQQLYQGAMAKLEHCE